MNSTRWRIQQAVQTVIADVAAAGSAMLLKSPALPIAAPKSESRVLYVRDFGDSLIEQPGQREDRRVSIELGAFVRGPLDDAEREVDALHFAARIAMRKPLRAVWHAARIDVSRVHEAEVDRERKEIRTDGVLLFSVYEIDYSEIYPDPAPFF